MGSLPNLHLLSASDDWRPHRLTLPPAPPPPKKRRKTLVHTRSLGCDPNSCLDAVTATAVASCSPPAASSYDSRFFKKSTCNARKLSSLLGGDRRLSRGTRSSSVVTFASGGGGGGAVAASSSWSTLCNGAQQQPPPPPRVSRQPSVSSSTGTSSVRQLIAVVRSTPSHLGPVYSRPLICQSFVALCLAHGLLTVAFVPVVVLEGSVSAWSSSFPGASAVGSLLAATLYAAAAACAPFAGTVNQRLGATRSLALAHLAAAFFVAAHLYPRLYALAPAYVLGGLSLAHLDSAETSYTMTLAAKLRLVPSDEETSQLRRDQLEAGATTRAGGRSLVHKLYCGVSLAHNVGLVAGGLLTYALVRLTASPAASSSPRRPYVAGAVAATRAGEAGRRTTRTADPSDCLCGYEWCPRDAASPLDEYANRTRRADAVAATRPSDALGGGGGVGAVLPCKTTAVLAGVFLGCCVVAALVSRLLVHRLRARHAPPPGPRSKFENAFATLRQTLRDSRLRLLTPLLVFIGLEQGFMYADFTELYAICVLGVESAPLVFVSLGALQFVAGVTLSLLIHQGVRRYLIVGAGVLFQGCLLLVLIAWKPTSDDAALLYVISAAWGVCNAIWDTLTFSWLLSSFAECCEPAFSHRLLCRYAGLSLAFAGHRYACASVKLYLMSAALLVAVCPYAWLELTSESRRRSSPAGVRALAAAAAAGGLATRRNLVHAWRRRRR